LFNFIADLSHPAAVLVSMIGVISQVCKLPSPLGSSRQPQTCQSFRLGSGGGAIAAFKIDKMVVSTIDVTIQSDYSSSPGQWQEIN